MCIPKEIKSLHPACSHGIRDFPYSVNKQGVTNNISLNCFLGHGSYGVSEYSQKFVIPNICKYEGEKGFAVFRNKMLNIEIVSNICAVTVTKIIIMNIFLLTINSRST